MHHPLSCRCGAVRGHVSRPRHSSHMACYCRDCRAYARFLGRPAEVLDAAGGTQIVAVQPAQLRFTQGVDALACMSLSGTGMLRWYAGCCNTAVGNTPRTASMPYVGLVHSCLQGPGAPALDESFGPLRMRLNTAAALAPVQATPLRTVLGTVALMRRVAVARLGGGYKINPLFEAATGAPILQPQVLSAAERAQLDDGAFKP